MKIGRNSPCPCGSGKKHKRCCGDPLKAQRSMDAKIPDMAAIAARAQEALRAHQAVESVRQQQQGYGKPILSWQDHGYRLVAVKNKILWSRKWIVFPDFLLDFLKDTLGREWGTAELKKGSSHPLFRWLTKFQQQSEKIAVQGQLKSGPMTGVFACILRLAYALYLIAHHDHIPKKLLNRLRNPKEFLPAYYEAIAGASLAVAGFEISNAETKSSADATPEYRATLKSSGGMFEIEAKRKERWKAPTHDVSNPEFKAELAGYIRDQVYKASRKKLKNPIFWFELSIPTELSAADWQTIRRHVSETLKEAENMTVDGKPLAPAYVTVTSHAFLANEDMPSESSVALLETILIPDFPFGRAMEIEEALTAYDKHRDVISTMEGWRIARSVPVTFDGSPPELLSPDGEPQRTVQIGDMLKVPNEAGEFVDVRVEEVVSTGDTAWVIVHDEKENKRWHATFPLTPEEARAAECYTDAIFGNANTSRGLRHDDPFDLYDWLLKCYGRMTQEQVAKAIRDQPAFRKFEALPLKEARIGIAREYTKWMWARSGAREDGRHGATSEAGTVAD